MRSWIVGLIVLVASCGKGQQPNRHFCKTAMLGLVTIVVDLDAAAGALGRADGDCATVLLQTDKARAAAYSYVSAVTPFRDDPEAGKVLEVLDRLDLHNFLLFCDGSKTSENTPEQQATNKANLKKVKSLLEQAIAVCTKPSA